MWINDKERLGKNKRGMNMEWLKKNWDILFAIGASVLIIFGFCLWCINRQKEPDYIYELNETKYKCVSGWYDQRYTEKDIEQSGYEDPYEMVKAYAKTYSGKIKNWRWDKKQSEPEAYWCEFCYNWKKR